MAGPLGPADSSPPASVPARPEENDLTLHRDRLRNALFVAAGALGFAVFFTVQNWVRARLYIGQFSVKNLLVESLTRWPLYALLLPVVGWMVDRYPFVRGRIARRAMLHGLAATVIAIAHSTGVGLVYRTFHIYPRQDTIFEAISRLTLAFFGLNVAVYGALAGVFHAIRYHREVREHDRLAASLRARLVEARLDHLRAQLNPHFLFKTLNAVSTLALTGEREPVVATLSSLSTLLRVAFDRSLPQEIPLARELEILDQYLAVQRVRFGDRLTVVTTIADDAREAQLPSMMLQPLVENALHHGLERRPGPGRVTISARRAGTTLEVRVEDTGPGLAPAANGLREGIGLANTRARLVELYGDAQSLTIANAEGGGACVEVVIPYRSADDVEPPAAAPAGATNGTPA